MDQILIAIAAKIAEYTVQPVGQWLCYSFHYDNNIRNMKNQVRVLEAARNRELHRVNEAENNVEEIEHDVKLWLTEVDDILGKVNEVLDNEDNANKSCSQMACPNVKLRHKHSKKAKNIMQEIDELLKRGKFDKVSYRPTSQGLVSTTNMDWVTFESRMSTMKELMESLKDANINKIGVWGMAGVGKTTLVREVASQVKKENLFAVVAIATVKQRLDDTGKLRIQGEIADELGLQLDKMETLSGRASLLRTRLTKDSGKLEIQGVHELDLKFDKKETLSGRASVQQTISTKDETKKILIIVDDIWEKLDLSEIGIPCEGCKVVITSRERDIFSEMSVQKEFRLDVLPRKEAWLLFEKLVGDSLKDQLRLIAIDISEECAGLPLALITVANALKNKSESQWKNALQQLRQPSYTNCTRMQKVIYSAIQLSYNHLENSEVQSFFLFCGHQKDPYIDYACLLKFCFGLKLFHGTNTLEVARNRMDTLLHDLKGSGLLLDFTSDYVLMHDLVIDAAIYIASQTENVLLMRGDDPITWPSEEKMKTYTDIFVHDMGIKKFPDALECPKLKFLFVHGKDCPLEISETFCKGMRELKVLDLTKFRISLLPSSINLLTNLKTLCLDQCVLEDIAMIGEMRNLEILSLLDSNVEQLPREIGLLTHLRMLDLSNCTELKVIPPNVLSCLIQLEELYVRNSFTQWAVKGLDNERASLAELKHLIRLTTLEVHIPDANMLPKDLSFEKLQRYKIFVGDVWDWSDKHENSRALKLKLNTSFHLERGIIMLLNRIENLCLDELKGVKSVINELDMTGFQQLKHLHVQNNVEIKYIINSSGMVISDVVFPVLEILSLKNMINLEEICHGQIPLASFHSLSIMEVEHCEKLKFIFSSTIAKGLPQLQKLVIQECSIMGAIIKKEEGEIEDNDMNLFPQLRHLELHQLPKLVSFLNTQKSVINDAGEIIPECELDFHMPILQEQVVFPNLETLELSSIHSEEILLHNQHRPSSSFKLTDSRFHNLRDLTVKGIGNLKYLLSSSTATFMVQLKYLNIEDCKVIEEILLTEDLGEEEIIPKVLFPKLEDLFLQDLPVLKRFCIGSNIRFPSLQYLCIEQCPKLESFIFKPVSSEEMNSEEISRNAMQPLFNEKVEFTNLETLIISHMPNLKIIWHDKFAPGSFTKLQSMTVLFCENLMKIFQVNMLSRFQSLESLVVEDCDSLEEIFELQGQEVMETRAVTITQLKELFMRRLPKLKRVWNMEPQGMFSFPNLQRIVAGECEILKSLFPTSVARCLQQLETLQIVECGIKEIIEQEEGAKEDARFVFPKLTHLMLRKLSKLKWFYRGVYTSEWPLLKTLEVSGSNEIQIFASKNYRIQEKDEQIQLETPIQQPLFLVEEVAFPSLEILTIMHMENLKIIWHDQLAEDSFSKLQSLFVEYCENLVNIFESNMLTRFQSLERLQVAYCGSLQEVFELQRHDVRESHAVTAIPLKRLILHYLPKMKQVWNKDPHGIFSFQNLQEISVSECESLKSLFPASVARCLMQLEDLLIAECGVEEIVSREEIAEAAARFVFPKVTLLILRKLPKLKWFCRGVHTSEWPLLKKLDVSECDQIEIFASKILNFQETVEQSQLETSTQQPLFLVEEGTLFPNLEVLTLGGNLKMKEMQCDQLLEECFYKLKDLYIIGYLAVSDWINFLKRLHSLEKLFVKLTSWEEIFPYEQLFDQENNATILAQLRELKLYELPTLTHLWKEDTQPSPILYNLENLIVSFCDKLKILVPSSISFQNLTNLEILKCHGLINLVTSSTAKSLVQLKKMSVSECERITEVVVGEGGEASEVITFTQLIYLKLDSLPNLASFCSKSYSFNFPSLEEVIVRQCPEMKTFSYGALGTPKLKKVQATQEDEWHWKDDLNTTIHWLAQ